MPSGYHVYLHIMPHEFVAFIKDIKSYIGEYIPSKDKVISVFRILGEQVKITAYLPIVGEFR
jgi:hypothetical protein